MFKNSFTRGNWLEDGVFVGEVFAKYSRSKTDKKIKSIDPNPTFAVA